MADAVEGERPRLLLNAQGVGQPQIRMPHHSPNVPDAPAHERLGHEVADRAHVPPLLLESHVDAIVADLHRIGGHAVVVPPRRRARKGVEVPPVPGTPKHAVLDRALPEWPPLVWTAVVQCRETTFEARHAKGRMGACDGLHATLWKLVHVEDTVPDTVAAHGGQRGGFGL